MFSRIEHFTYGEEQRGKFVLWNNKDIAVDQKTLFWKTWFEQGIYFVQDLLSKEGKFSSLEEFLEKFGLKVNYVHYSQIIAAMPREFAEAIFTANPNLL